MCCRRIVAGWMILAGVVSVGLCGVSNARAQASDAEDTGAGPFPTKPIQPIKSRQGQPGFQPGGPALDHHTGPPPVANADGSLDAPIPGQLVGAGAKPTWIKEGVRLSYELSVADPATGSSGTGVLQVDFNAVTPDVVAGSISQWNDVEGNGAWALANTNGFVSPPSGEADGYWIAPEALAQLAQALSTEESKRNGYQVFEGKLEVKGRSYDTITIVKQGADEKQSTSYEKSSGVVVQSAYLKMHQGQMVPRQVYQIASVRMRQYPWIEGRPPAWALKVRTLQYQGQIMSQFPGQQPMQAPLGFLAQVEKTGRNWLLLSTSLSLNGQQQAQAKTVSAVSQMGGLFLPPLALREMKQGQQLDQDPVTGATTRVLFVGQAQHGRNVVTIEEQTRGYRRVADYELSTGILLLITQHVPSQGQSIQLYFTGIQ